MGFKKWRRPKAPKRRDRAELCLDCRRKLLPPEFRSRPQIKAHLCNKCWFKRMPRRHGPTSRAPSAPIKPVANRPGYCTNPGCGNRTTFPSNADWHRVEMRLCRECYGPPLFE